MILEHIAGRDGRLLSFLRGELGLSAGLIRRLKWQDALHVDGAPAHTDRRVVAGERITVRIEEAVAGFPAEDGPLSIVYEDEAILVVDKPAGLMAHPTFNRTCGTLANRLLGYYRRTGQPSAIHFVNRLDRDTFGLVLVAKNAHVHAILCGQQRVGGIRKLYHAAVLGRPGADRGEICHPIARLSPTSLLRCVRKDGKPACTQYETLRTDGACSLLGLEPVTGRTHQLRVHCAYEGYPILGDVQYGTEASVAFSRAHGYAHQQLCAVALDFAHPMTGEAVAVRSGFVVGLPGER